MITEQKKGYNRKYREKHLEKLKQYGKDWHKKKQNLCNQCGQPCHYKTNICRKCWLEKIRSHKPTNCIICNKPISKNATIGLCCSCKAKQSYKTGKRKIFDQPKGELSPHWKGGRHIHDGYMLVYAPEHPRASESYVPEHILVWETYHNKPLPKGWEVHHYNGIKDDNRPSNLFAKSKKQHRLIIPEFQKKIQELEAMLNHQGQLL